MQKFKMATKNGSMFHFFQDKCVFVFYAEWWGNDFWKKSPVDSADTLGVKNCAKIALSDTVSEINAFLLFTLKFKMMAKMVGK